MKLRKADSQSPRRFLRARPRPNGEGEEEEEKRGGRKTLREARAEEEEAPLLQRTGNYRVRCFLFSFLPDRKYVADTSISRRSRAARESD
jgi:hypothetical protein